MLNLVLMFICVDFSTNSVNNTKIVTLNLIQGRKGLKIVLPASRFGLIDFNLAIPKRVRNDGTIFVTLNLFQGRKGGDYQLQPCDSGSSPE